MSDLRLVFAGSPAFAATVLDDLVRHDFSPLAVYTQPDRPAGRGRRIVGSPVKEMATGHGLLVVQPASLKETATQAALARLTPDILIVVAYGLILPRAVLEIPAYGCINVHASLLPRWRGAAPIERAFMAGDEQTGISIMQMDEGLDTGPVYTREALPMAGLSITELEDRLADLGSTLLRATLARFTQARAAGTALPGTEPQSQVGATYAHKLTAADRILDFGQDAQSLARQVNALAARMPTRIKVAGKAMQILEAQIQPGQSEQRPGEVVSLDHDGLLLQCAIDQLLVTQVKLEGGKGSVLDGAALSNGYRHVISTGLQVQ